jgi:hypothetical protein
VAELRLVRPLRASRVIPILALLVGVLLIMQGLLGIVAPDVFVGLVRFFRAPSMIYLAAALRVAIGVVLLRAATASRVSVFLWVFALLIAIGGALTPFFGVRFADSILGLWASRGPGLVRLFALASLVLGLLTVCAVLPPRRRA